jgi:hypothetical protein
MEHMEQVTQLAEWVINMEQKLIIKKDSKMREIQMDKTVSLIQPTEKQNRLCSQFSIQIDTIAQNLKALIEAGPGTDEAEDIILWTQRHLLKLQEIQKELSESI